MVSSEHVQPYAKKKKTSLPDYAAKSIPIKHPSIYETRLASNLLSSGSARCIIANFCSTSSSRLPSVVYTANGNRNTIHRPSLKVVAKGQVNFSHFWRIRVDGNQKDFFIHSPEAAASQSTYHYVPCTESIEHSTSITKRGSLFMDFAARNKRFRIYHYN